MAAIVTKAPLRSNSSSSRGMAAISLDLPSTATWPRLSPAWVAQTLTRWSMPRPRACEPDEHKALPSMAMWSMPRADADAGGQPAPQAEVQAARGQRGEDALEGAARGDAVGQVQEGREPAGALRGEGDDLGPVVGPGDGGAQGDGDDAEQRVGSLSRLLLLRGSRRPLKQCQMETFSPSMTSPRPHGRRPILPPGSCATQPHPRQSGRSGMRWP